MPQDFDRALQRMKSDLALTELKRQLLDPDRDARSVLELTERIQAIQGGWRRRRAGPRILRWIASRDA